MGQYFGATVSIEFLRVSDQHRIALGDDGKVYGFSEASATADKRALF